MSRAAERRGRGRARPTERVNHPIHPMLPQITIPNIAVPTIAFPDVGIPLRQVDRHLRGVDAFWRSKVKSLIQRGVAFLGQSREEGRHLVGTRHGRIRRYDNLSDLRRDFRGLSQGTIIAVREGVVPFGRTGQTVTAGVTRNPVPIMLSVVGATLAVKIGLAVLAALTGFGMYIVYRVFRPPEAREVDRTPETITFTSNGRIVTTDRQTGRVIDTAEPPAGRFPTLPTIPDWATPIMVVGGLAVAGFVLVKAMEKRE